MAKKQTRRSVSIRGTTYETIREYCEKHGVSMSEFVEERIAGFFGNPTQAAAPKLMVAEAPRPVAPPPPAVPVQQVKPAPSPEPAPAPRPITMKAPQAPVPSVVPGNGARTGQAAAAELSKLSKEELQDAARFFTF